MEQQTETERILQNEVLKWVIEGLPLAEQNKIVAVMYDTTDHKISAIVCFLISLGFGVGAIMQ